MSAHTPGPWEKKTVLVRGATFLASAHFETAEGEANTRLIAAAPELLAQLGDLVEIVDAAIAAGDWKVDGCCDPDLTLQKARVALAKAEGR